jgi:hypothetical protein
LHHKAELQEFWYGRGGKFSVMEELGFATKFESLFFSKLQEKLDFIFIINHLIDARDETSDEEMKPIIIGKKTSASKPLLVQKAKARFWLVPTDGHLCPSVIVTKNPGLGRITDRGYETVTFLPPKISPFALPDWKERQFISVWDVIKHYEEHPFSEKYPNIESYEVVSDKEREMVSEDITDSDKQRMAQYALIIENQKKLELIESVRSILEENSKLPEMLVWARIKKDSPHVTQEQVKTVIESLKGE